MRRRDVVSALTEESCERLRNKGGHEVWGCPCGRHIAPVPNHQMISPGTVRSIAEQMSCLKKGWLQ